MAAHTVLHGEEEVRAAVGTHLGHSEWFTVDAHHLELFTEATGDGAATYLALSLSNLFLPQIVEVTGFEMGINYGTDAVRFPTPLAAGQRLRGSAFLRDVSDVRGGIQTMMDIEISTQDGDVVCTIESISRWLQ